MLEQLPIIFCVLAFFMINLLVVVKRYRKPLDFGAYSVGNRSFGCILFSFTYIGFWAVGSMYISWFSSAARVGIFAQYILIYSISSLVILYFMARPVWLWGKKFDLHTQADLIGLRYGSKPFQQFFSLITFFLWIPWLVLEMKIVGYAVSVATDYHVDANLSMAIVCLFVIMYTYYGGMRGSAVACVVQVSAFVGIGLIVTSVMIYKIYGGFFNVYSIVEETAPELLTLTSESAGLTWTSIVITSALGAYCLPGMFRLLYIADSHKTIKKSILIVPLAFMTSSFVLLLLGMGGLSIPGFPMGSESSLFWLAKTYGGSIIVGLIAVFTLAASMSTMSGVIGTSAIIISKDWLGDLTRNKSDRNLLRYAKASTVWVGIICLFIAAIDIPDLLRIIQLMYDCVVQAFIPLFFGLYWKRSNLQGAAIGMVTGILIALCGNVYPHLILFANGWSAGMIGLAANLVIHIIGGYLFGAQKHVEDLFRHLD